MSARRERPTTYERVHCSVWLGSVESKEVTGRIFELAGGEVSLADGWRSTKPIDKGDRWEPDELGAVVHELLQKNPEPQKVYGT